MQNKPVASTTVHYESNRLIEQVALQLESTRVRYAPPQSKKAIPSWRTRGLPVMVAKGWYQFQTQQVEEMNHPLL